MNKIGGSGRKLKGLTEEGGRGGGWGWKGVEGGLRLWKGVDWSGR